MNGNSENGVTVTGLYLSQNLAIKVFILLQCLSLQPLGVDQGEEILFLDLAPLGNYDHAGIPLVFFVVSQHSCSFVPH